MVTVLLYQLLLNLFCLLGQQLDSLHHGLLVSFVSSLSLSFGYRKGRSISSLHHPLHKLLLVLLNLFVDLFQFIVTESIKLKVERFADTHAGYLEWPPSGLWYFLIVHHQVVVGVQLLL